ncbi:MAG: primosomal protein N' [Planctomycetota bacterium]
MNFVMLECMSDQQQNLFETEPAPWQIDDQDDWIAARVVFSSAPFGPYDYSIPAELQNQIEVGSRVAVPLGRSNRAMEGYCIDVLTPGHPHANSVNPRRLKPVSKSLDQKPIIDRSLLKLASWISEYYVCPLGSVIDTVVPPAVRDGSGTREVLFLSLAEKLSGKLAELKATPKQRAILELLEKGGYDWTPRELAQTAGCTQGPVNTLRKKGWIVASSRRIRSSHSIPNEKRESDLQLNPDQHRALEHVRDAIDQDRYECFLMHGITGSGKTEVYIRAIQRVVEFGRQAIVLVPEISLTPQTRQRFRARFDRVAVLHSHLTAAERAWHWNEIANGNIQVIIGARSAVFAPVPRLGLIVIDEEHDGSFKQDKAPRYHAREVAIERSKAAQIPLILGSATPAIESWHRAEKREFTRLNLPRRAMDRPLPDVATIDLRLDYEGRKRPGAISQKLRQEIRTAIQMEGQVILLLNRRGFSTRIQCPACGNALQCPDCSIPLTHHREGDKAICHYCDFARPAPDRCPDCDFEAIRFSGIGTQKLEAEVKSLFPDFICERMDTDTMRRPGSHEETLNRFRNGEIQILLGTQMIAKGLDFPNVTLVGVVNADTSLHFPDFRAAERTFGLVTQVAGRSGRGSKGGRVLVQTFSPDNKAIQAATRHDYEKFVGNELPERMQFRYPPFGSLTRIVVRGESEIKTRQATEQIAAETAKASSFLNVEVAVLGPAKATVEKLRGKYRFHILLRTAGPGLVQPVIRRVQNQVSVGDEVQWIVDIDPQDML